MTSKIRLVLLCWTLIGSAKAQGDGDHNGGNSWALPDRIEGNAQGIILTETEPKWPRFNCTGLYRPHKNDSNKFQILYNGVWFDQSCQTQLVWNQSVCRCDFPNGSPVVRCPGHRPHKKDIAKYEVRVNNKWIERTCNTGIVRLVWNQVGCRCEWDPKGPKGIFKDPSQNSKYQKCDPMLNVTFDDGIYDHARGSFIGRTLGENLILYGVDGHVGNKAAYIKDSYFTVWHFAGNELSDSLRVDFKFKADNDPELKDKYQIFISNGCNVTGIGYVTPSIAIGYKPQDKTFLLALETNVRKAALCRVDVKPFEWHHLSLIYEESTVILKVDDYPCVISQEFKGAVHPTQCPLTIGSDPLEAESSFHGYIDEIIIWRYCRGQLRSNTVKPPATANADKQEDEPRLPPVAQKTPYETVVKEPENRIRIDSMSALV